MDKLAKTIGEINQRLCEDDLSPPTIVRLYSLIPKEVLNSGLEHTSFIENRVNCKIEIYNLVHIQGMSRYFITFQILPFYK